MKNKRFFPLFVDLTGKPVVIVGGGNIAARRARVLADFADCICVIAPQIHPEIRELQLHGQVSVCEREYLPEDLTYAYMVIAATNSAITNGQIYDICKSQGIYVNVVNSKELCDFYFPGIVKKEELVIGINAGGMNHSLAKEVRVELERYFSQKEDEEIEK